MDGSLDGEVAIVTGAGRNIGESIASLFAEAGAAVVVADVDSDRAAGTVDRIRDAGGEATSAVGDVSTVEGAEHVVDVAEEQYGPVDVLVNNAAVKERVPLLEMDPETFDRTLAVNLRGAFLCTKHAAPSMATSGGGRIVNVSSTSGLSGRADSAAYATTKAALLNFTRCAAVALADDDVRVNTLIPTRTGVRTLSPAAVSADDESAAFEGHATLVGRGGEPIDQARAALFLVTSDSDFVTGTSLRVDGGRHV